MPYSYILGEKFCFNNKYIKKRCNYKLEAKFFRYFKVFHPIVKQTYKFELSAW